MTDFRITEDELKKYTIGGNKEKRYSQGTFKLTEGELKKYTVQPIRQASKPQNKNIVKAAGDADEEVSTAKAKPKTSGSLSAYDEAVRRSFNDASGNYNPQTGINEGYGTVTPGAKPINALLDVIYNKAVNPIANKAYDVYEKADDYAVNEDYLSRMKAAAEEQAQGQAFNDEGLRLNRALNERKQWLSGMTDEQKRTYLLLPEKERKDYLDSIEDELNQKAGIKEAQYVLGKGKETASPAGYAFAAGVQNFKSGLEGAVNLLRGKEGETAARGDLEYAYGAVAPTLEGGHKVLSDLAYTTGNMAPSMALGLVSGGLGTAAMGISSAGNSYDEAIREGYKPEESAAYGIASGIKEAALQRVAGALPGVSNAQSVLSKALGKYGDKAAKALIKNEALRTSLERIVGNALSEGSEEYVQEILDPILRNIFLKEDNEVKLFTPEAAYAGFLGGISGGMFELPGAIRAGVEVKRGKAPHSISLEEFTNNDSPIWNNVDYNDKETQVKITKELHDRMVQNNEVVDVPETERVNEAHPDLTHLKKKERNVILRDKIKQLKTDLKTMLEGLGETPVEFNVNNNLIEARLYGTGIREVLKKLTKDKSNMLYQSKEIFKNSKYLYSTQDYDGNEGIYRWNYFYTPVKIGDDIVGVRIAVRDMKKAAESQLYNWDIKKEAPVEGTQGGLNLARELSHKEASGSAEPNNIISDNTENINNLGAETEITNRQNTESLQPELRDSLETTEEETALPERDTESLQPEATDELTTTEETAPSAEEEVQESAERAAMRHRALETVNKNSPDAQRIYREIMSNYGYGKVIQNIDAAAEKLGTKITYYAEDGRAEGYAEDGSIYLNVKNLRSTQEGVWRLFKHELSHTLQGATKAYGKLFSSKAGQELFNKFLKDNGYANITELENEIRSRYGKNGKSLTEEELNYELMARFIEDSDILTSEESIRKLTEASPNLAERIIEWFKYMRTMFKGTEYDKQLAQAERLYLKAVKEAQKNGAYSGGQETGKNHSLRDVRVPESYEELTSKPDIEIVDIRNSYGKSIKNIESSLKKSGIYNEPVINKDTNESIFFNGKGVAHSISNGGVENVYASEHMPEIIENAVLAFKQNDRHERSTADQVYVFFGAVRGEKGCYPVKLMIKEYDISKQANLPENVKSYFEKNGKSQMYATLYDNKVVGKVFNVEDIEIAGEIPYISQGGSGKQNGNPGYEYSPATTISVAELLKNVNEETRKYIPAKVDTGNNGTGRQYSIAGETEAGDTESSRKSDETERKTDSIKTDGKKNIAFLDGLKIDRQPGEKRNEAIKRFFNNNFKNKEIEIIENQEKVTTDQIGKYLYPGEIRQNYDVKINSIPILDDIIKVATNKTHSADLLVNGQKKNHSGLDATNGWDYYDTLFAVDDSGVIWGGKVVIRDAKNGKSYFYDLDEIRVVGYQDVNEFNPVEYGQTTLNNNILPKNEFDNTKLDGNNRQYSISGETEIGDTETSRYSTEPEVQESAERAVMRHRALETVNRNSPDAQRIYREIMSNYGYGKVIQNMDAVAKKLGTKITYYAEDSRAEGYAEDGSIYLNVKNLRSTQEGVWRLFKHELSHTLQEMSEAYDRLFESEEGDKLLDEFLKNNKWTSVTELKNEIRRG